MYNLSNRFKIFSLSLIILGSLGWFYSYSKSHLTIEEVRTLLSEESHYGTHSDQTHSMDHLNEIHHNEGVYDCLLYTSPSPRDKRQSRMPSSA